MWIKGTETVSEGKTAKFEGKMVFDQTIRHLKWQKYQYDKFMDINIHNKKYKGSKNELINPRLEIHDVHGEDALKYRLEVKLETTSWQSNEITLKVESVSGLFYGPSLSIMR